MDSDALSHTFALPFWKEVVEIESNPRIITMKLPVMELKPKALSFYQTFFEWMIIDSGPLSGGNFGEELILKEADRAIGLQDKEKSRAMRSDR